VSVDVGADGKVNFDAIVKQGTNRNKTVFTKLADMKVGGNNGRSEGPPSHGRSLMICTPPHCVG
jgi:hypothetical protein